MDREMHRALVDAGYAPLPEYIAQHSSPLACLNDAAEAVFRKMLRVNDPSLLWAAMEEELAAHGWVIRHK